MLHDRPSLAVAADPGRAVATLCPDAAAAGRAQRPEARIPHLDRLARSLKQLIETVEGFAARDAGLRSLTETIDTTTAGGKLVFHIFAALAEFERGVIRERTLAGLQAARARGRTGGRPPALKAKDLAAAKALLRDPEITVVQVAKRLGVAASTLYRHLPRARTAALEA